MLILAATLAIVAMLVWPSGEEDPGASDAPASDEEAAAPTTTTAPATTAPGDTDAPAISTSAAADLGASSSLSEPEASVEPAGGLPPQATVLITAEQPFLTRAEAGIAFCAVGVEDACTSVPTSDHVLGGDRNQLTVVLPRTFTTWNGDRHDCIDDAACEVRLWAQDGAVFELNVPVEFAPGEPAPAVPVETSAVDGLQAHDLVSLRIAAHATVVVVQCVVDVVDGCGTADDFVQQPDGFAELDVTVDRRIFTRQGPYDCALGACELRIILADANHAAAIPLGFDPTSDLGLPVVGVRPTAGLAHGTLIELRTPDEVSGVTGYSLCAPEEVLCAHLGNRAASEELVVRVPRWIEDRLDSRLVDCAISRCVIRTLVANEVIDTPLDFTGAETGPPPVTVVLGRQTGQTLVAGEELSIAARGLFVLSAEVVGRTGVTVRYCEDSDAPTSHCVNAVGDGEGLLIDGSFSTTVVIPNFDRRRSRINPGGTRSPFCSETCWVVVEPRLDVPGGAIEIDIQTPGEAQG